jgi:hypothetical protein
MMLRDIIVPDTAPLNQPCWFDQRGLVLNEKNMSFAGALTCWSKRSKVSCLQDVNVCGGGEYHIPVIYPPNLKRVSGQGITTSTLPGPKGDLPWHFLLIQT